MAFVKRVWEFGLKPQVGKLDYLLWRESWFAWPKVSGLFVAWAARLLEELDAVVVRRVLFSRGYGQPADHAVDLSGSSAEKSARRAPWRGKSVAADDV